MENVTDADIKNAAIEEGIITIYKMDTKGLEELQIEEVLRVSKE